MNLFSGTVTPALASFLAPVYFPAEFSRRGLSGLCVHFSFHFFLDKKVAKNQGFRKIAKNDVFYRK
jgi:hypothetical protein